MIEATNNNSEQEDAVLAASAFPSTQPVLTDRAAQTTATKTQNATAAKTPKATAANATQPSIAGSADTPAQPCTIILQSINNAIVSRDLLRTVAI